jgi:Flp pilus assembly pilin Flp
MVKKIATTIHQLQQAEDGATAIEYALIAALVAAGLAGGIGILAGGIEAVYALIVAGI